MDTNNSSGYQLPSVDDSQLKGDSQVPSVIPVDPVTQQPGTTYAAPADPTMPVYADDIDLIEKAWVEKAKSIVRSTHGDPYKQNKELSRVKADYIKKRYNRDVKVVD
jgi:hypothetical protein